MGLKFKKYSKLAIDLNVDQYYLFYVVKFLNHNLNIFFSFFPFKSYTENIVKSFHFCFNFFKLPVSYPEL